MTFSFGCFIRSQRLSSRRSISDAKRAETGSLIIASNHRNSYDPGLIAAARVRKIHYMAKLELFNLNKLASWMLRHLNAFPISRGTGDQRSLNYAIRLVEEGKVLGIFPEGTRSKDPDGKMLPPKAGIALIAKAPMPMFCLHAFILRARASSARR